MAYNTEILKELVTIIVPSTTEGNLSAKTVWTTGSTIHAAVDWTRGTRAMRQGSIDVYSTIMVRCRYTSELTKFCRLEWNDTYYIIDSFHSDKKENTIQITAFEVESGFTITE